MVRNASAVDSSVKWSLRSKKPRLSPRKYPPEVAGTHRGALWQIKNPDVAGAIVVAQSGTGEGSWANLMLGVPKLRAPHGLAADAIVLVKSIRGRLHHEYSLATIPTSPKSPAGAHRVVLF